tara:strand:+ start:1590 stop:1835 length:246 start_codon:yes stop_codon:yes gene_type:complete
MNKLYTATLDHWRAKRSEAIATLDIYFNNSVGIGEHSGVMEEIYNWTKTLDEAESILETLGRNFDEDITKTSDQSFEAISS